LSKYADLFNFDVVQPAIFDPRELVKTIKAAESAGYDVCLIDSLSHYWMGKGGELDLVDAVAKKSNSNNSFAAWKTVTPFHNELVETIIRAKLHIICTMRTKTEWVTEKDERTGKMSPRKIGLAPVMRDGIEFEFDVCGDLDQENTLIITKSRCPELSGKVINRPGAEMAATLKEWLSGAPVEEPKATTTPDPAKPKADFYEVMAAESSRVGREAFETTLLHFGFDAVSDIPEDRRKAVYGKLKMLPAIHQEELV
jgi:hypothetical protein